MQTQRIPNSSTERGSSRGLLRPGLSGALGGVLALVAGGLVVVSALFVSAIVFSVLLVAGTIAGGWFWWKTRGMRKSLRERMSVMQRAQAARQSGQTDEPSGQVLDGDFIRETHAQTRR
jgi:hypothetical protein